MSRAEGHSHCLRCGRRLYSAASRSAGYGSGCRAKIRAARRLADLATWTARQLEQARELIEDGGVIPTAKRSVFRTVATAGDAVYLTSATGCTCPASKECYHRAAVVILAAA